MKQYRKTAAALCLMACLSAVVPQAFAAEVPDASEAVPYMLYIRSYDCSLSVSGGEADVSAWVKGLAGEATRAKVVVELQELNTTWKTIQTWSETEDNYRASVSGSALVTSGKYYRVKATVTVWVGSQSETKTVISNSRQA